MKEQTHNKQMEIADNYHNGNKTDFYKAIEKMSKAQMLHFINTFKEETDFAMIILLYYINK